MLIANGSFRGDNSTRQLAQRLHEALLDTTLQYQMVLVDGEVKTLAWNAQATRS